MLVRGCLFRISDMPDIFDPGLERSEEWPKVKKALIDSTIADQQAMCQATPLKWVGDQTLND